MSDTLSSCRRMRISKSWRASPDLGQRAGRRARRAGRIIEPLTKNVLDTALEAEMDEHLGYEKHDVSGHGSENSRNGMRAKIVLTKSARWRWTCLENPPLNGLPHASRVPGLARTPCITVARS
ncbi:transposase [Arthrobacter crystallopoietes]|uniref:transposase n=1 Tax=Crystallibacter crystallopoietes TaxID=37928 RepID=UPI003D24C594